MRPGDAREPSHPTAILGDADAVARAELAQLLTSVGYAVVEAADGAEALALALTKRPDLVVLDVALGGTSAYEVCRRLRETHGQRLPIALVTEHRIEPADEVAGLLLGADEYFAKPIHADLFVARIRRVLARTAPPPAHSSTLTPRENEVLALLVHGVEPRDIAARLGITDKTTATHIEHILAKVGAHSRAQAVAFAVRDHMVQAPAA
jgi:DNA-binding NarL/FixJ family response regulator